MTSERQLPDDVHLENQYMNRHIILIFFVFIVQFLPTHGQSPGFAVNILSHKLESITVKGTKLLFEKNKFLGFVNDDSSVLYRESEKLFLFYGINTGLNTDGLLQLQLEGNIPVISYKNYRKVLEPSDLKPFIGTIDTVGRHGIAYGLDKSDVQVIYFNAYIERIDINKKRQKFTLTINKSKKDYNWDITYYMDEEFLFVYNHEKKRIRGMLSCRSKKGSIENSIDVYFKDGVISEIKRYFESKNGFIPVNIIKYNKKGGVAKVIDMLYSSS